MFDATQELTQGTTRVRELAAAVARLEAAANTAGEAVGSLRQQIDGEQLRLDLGRVTDDTELKALRLQLVTEERAKGEALAAAGELKARIERAKSELALRAYQKDIEEYARLCTSDAVLVHDAARTVIAAVDAAELAYAHFQTKLVLWRKLEAYRQAQELPVVVERGVMGLQHINVNLNDLLEGKVRAAGDVIRKHVNRSMELK